jgi:hypothetical protein
MKSSFMRPAMALALALGLGACGGKASFPVNVSINPDFPVLYDGLVLTTNGMDLAVPAKAASTVFPNSLSYGETYAVTAKAQPLHQTCGVAGGADTAGRMASINVGVSCSLNAFPIGGSVSGLTTDGLVLTNGSNGGTVAVPNGATGFKFLIQDLNRGPNAYGSSYGVAVLTQPTSQTCSVSNGTGVMGDAEVTNIAITCVTNH